MTEQFEITDVKINPRPTEDMSSKLYKVHREHTLQIQTEIDKSIASFILSLPLPMSYETWKHLHSIKGDIND